jgi:hypothetical protein
VPVKVLRINWTGAPAINAAFQQMADILQSFLGMDARPPLSLDWTSSGPVLSYSAPRRAVFKLTANPGGGAYDGVEVQSDAAGVWSVVPSGFSVTLREYNGYPSIVVTSPVYAEAIYFTAVDEWRFQMGGCA